MIVEHGLLVRALYLLRQICPIQLQYLSLRGRGYLGNNQFCNFWAVLHSIIDSMLRPSVEVKDVICVGAEININRSFRFCYVTF